MNRLTSNRDIAQKNGHVGPKVGILNHWMVNNYGALFLSYALERKLLEMGYDAETVHWLPDEVRCPWKLSHLRKSGLIHYLLRLGYFTVFILPRERSFRHFRSLMNTGAKKYTDKTLPGIDEEYDKIVIGGDQLWNVKEVYFNENNFLPFVKEKEKKVAYCASISQDFIREDIRDSFREWVRDFSYVTVRETKAKELIEETAGVCACRVSDPAFLVRADDWSELAVELSKKKYIFVYQVQSDLLVIDFAKALAKKTGCSIVYCPFPMKKQIRCARRPYMSPEKWLGYMKNAEYVVTDAFHGAVFAIIFNRQFFVEISEYGKDTGSRITNILDVYSLQNRLLDKNNAEKLLSAEMIDFEPVNALIEAEIADAECHIREMLSSAQRSDDCEDQFGKYQ